MFEALVDYTILGLSAATAPNSLFYCFIGVTLGTFVGVIPGIGALATISMLIPITFHLEPLEALVMLAGIYYGTAYGGSIASILLRLPGTGSSAVTCIDGYPMAQQGRAGIALFMTAIASFVGASIGIIIMMVFSPLFVEIGLSFHSPEYFSLMVMGLVAASSITSDSQIKGIAMVVLGIFLGIVGTDINTGTSRYTFGITELTEGFTMSAIAMGSFGVAEVISSLRKFKGGTLTSKSIGLRSMVPTRDDVRRSWLPILRGSSTGSFVGALPGAGATIASFMSYAIERKVARDPSRFGKGAIEGIVAPEAANNAADQTAFIPTLTLGIPGSVTMALMLGVLMIHGITPGPSMMANHPDLFWGVVMSFWIGNIMLLILNVPLIGIWVRVLMIPYHVLYPAILMFACIGVYSIHQTTFDVITVIAFGLLGYFMRLIRFPVAPLLLGFVLGPMVEEYFRRALIISAGDVSIFFERPVSLMFLLITAALLLWSAWQSVRQSFQRKVVEAPLPGNEAAGARDGEAAQSR
ncbi:tripartite tricarboxylate transporter permease [Chelativorans alearense]|uniref:tripartite tricarboxylate transporter permease n=1 Tax=Chelativorans alearense TaxID=2681495 RepID=UPI0013D0F22C|nr:tripartite tricarboxylate transporter permease [Chelativorans alearense]